MNSSLFIKTSVYINQDEDLNIPYFSELRGHWDSVESVKRIKKMTSMIVWSQDVHGIIKMTQTRRRVLCRSKSADRVKKKSRIQTFASLQPNPNVENYDSMDYTSMESTTTYGSTIDRDTICEPWESETSTR